VLTKFTKMHGLGNDFVLIDAVRQAVDITPELVRRIADRNLGIGCDQVLIIEPPTAKNIDFNYRIFNCDGAEVEQCGNGARCMGRYIFDQQLSGKQSLQLQTKNRVMEVRSRGRHLIQVNMGSPQLDPSAIPFAAEQQQLLYEIEVGGEIHQLSAISMGNPHAVIQVADIETAPVADLGLQLQQHSRFPESVNVGFMAIKDRQHIQLRVFERGVGETQACGSGACAAAVAAIQSDLVDHAVQVALPGGELSIEWQGDGNAVSMTGPAVTVFHGKIKL